MITYRIFYGPGSVLIFLFFSLTNCNPKDKEKAKKASPRFNVQHFEFDCDTTINSIAFFNNFYLCCQDNGKIIILDSNYRRVPELEKKISLGNISLIANRRDSVFISTDGGEYFLTNDFKTKKIAGSRGIDYSFLFEDSKYYIYGCCAGEFGGSVFFKDKLQNKVYSYFATCASQVLHFQNKYIVCNNLAHLSGMMSFLIVNDPITLYELKEDSTKRFCNWWATVDSIKYTWGKSNIGNVKYYEGPYNTLSLLSFPFNDSLYSIITDSKASMVVVHRQDSIYVTDTIVPRHISFHQTSAIQAGNKFIALYNLTGGSPFEAYTTRGHISGLIVTDKNRIDLLNMKR